MAQSGSGCTLPACNSIVYSGGRQANRGNIRSLHPARQRRHFLNIKLQQAGPQACLPAVSGCLLPAVSALSAWLHV